MIMVGPGSGDEAYRYQLHSPRKSSSQPGYSQSWIKRAGSCCTQEIWEAEDTGILEAHRKWIENELQRVIDASPLIAPGCIDLNAVDESWQINYVSHSAYDGKFSVRESASNRLLVDEDVEDGRGVSSILIQWLHHKARAHLVPWLKEISREFDIPFQKATVRGQTTRWASCSQLGNIRLNRRLLFLPNNLVRHVFLHELYHIKKLNHSPEF